MIVSADFAHPFVHSPPPARFMATEHLIKEKHKFNESQLLNIPIL